MCVCVCVTVCVCTCTCSVLHTYVIAFCCPGVVHHISRLSIQDRVLDLSVKKDNGGLCRQSVDRPASTSSTSASLSVRRSDVPDKPSSPLPHLCVLCVINLTFHYLLRFCICLF